MRDSARGAFSLSALDGDLTFVPTIGMWHDRDGGLLAICGEGSTAPGELCLVLPDGKAIKRGSGGISRTGIGWTYNDRLALADVEGMREVDWETFEEIGFTSSASVTPLDNFAWLSDRFIWFDGNSVQRRVGASDFEECAIDTGNMGPGWIMPADLSRGRSWWWLVDCDSGRIYKYDAAAKLELGTPATATSTRTSYPGGCDFPWYSRKHNCFGRYFSPFLGWNVNEPKAAAIVGLAVPGGLGAPGRRRKIHAFVAGSDLEPCAGRAVTFSTTSGSIPVPTVLTDETGLAETYLYTDYDAVAGATLTADLVE